MAQTGNAASSAPGINGGQIDSGSLGDISNSVNMFRGDVNLPLTLVHLQGASGLDIDIKAFYGSNVHDQVKTWNMTASTDILGVGWTMPFEKITVDRPVASNEWEQNYYLVTGGAAQLMVRTGTRDGAITFQLVNHQFWDIRYYPGDFDPASERWEIVREDGSRFVYGGEGIQWGVRWGNWTGSTTAGSGRRYPTAWNLVEVRNAWEQSIFFGYEHDECLIGADPDARYTRASRLREIRDPAGRTVSFLYKDKEPCEIQLPATPAPGRANAIQFLFETHYLASVEVRSGPDRVVSRTVFDYELLNVAPYPHNTDDRYKKRYLTGARRLNGRGEGRPGLNFAYDADKDAVHPGALRGIVYPEGGKVAYEYERKTLSNTSTVMSIPSPEAGSVPRIWHGPDYTVVTWHSPASGRLLRIGVFTWGGEWVEWSDSPDWRAEADTIAVLPAAGFFTITYKDLATQEYRVHIYRSNPYRHGEWARSFQPALDTPVKEMAIAVGKDFVALSGDTASRLKIVSWNALDGRWTERSFGAGTHTHCALAAAGNTCIAAYHNAPDEELRLDIYYEDQSGDWRKGDTFSRKVTIDWDFTTPQSLLALGSSFATVTYIAEIEEEVIRYGTILASWNDRLEFGAPVAREHRQKGDVPLNPIGFSVIRDGVVGNGQHLARYTGERWAEKEIGEPKAETKYYYTYGQDAVVKVEHAGDAVLCRSYDFDPYTLAWKGPFSHEFPGGEEQPPIPTISGSYRTIANKLYYRNSSLEWEEIYTFPAAADLSTLCNVAPYYIAYQDKSGENTSIVFVKDGAVHGSPVELAGEKIVADEPAAGKSLAGLSGIVTYKGDEFDKARSLTLRRITADSLEHRQTSRAVSQIAIDDGYQTLRTFYDYDTATATYDAHGNVAQFVSARAYPGSRDGENGYTHNLYFNGLSPTVPGVVYPESDAFTNARNYFSLLNGQVFRSAIYDSDNRRVAITTNFPYVFDRQTTGLALAGAYVRLRKRIDAPEFFLFALDSRFEIELDESAFSDELRGTFAAKGFALSDAVAVNRGGYGSEWMILDERSGIEYSVDRGANGLAVSGSVKNVTESEYNSRGQVRRSVAYNCDSEGKAETLATVMRYGWEVYPEMEQANLLAPVAENASINETHGIITSIAVTTYRRDRDETPRWGVHKNYLWNGAAGTEAFDFGAWSGGDEPSAGWLRITRTLASTVNGLTSETDDVDGLRSSVLFDRENRFAVASFSNASLAGQEATYYGFEDYEDPQGWSVVPAGPSGEGLVGPGESYTGLRRLAIPGDAGAARGLRTTLAPANGHQKFLLTCWAKTPAGFDRAEEFAGWEVTAGNNVSEKTLRLPIAPTDGTWRYRHFIVEPAQFGIESFDRIALFVTNRCQGVTLLVDSIAFVPLLGSYTATVYNRDHIPIASLDMLGGTKQHLYDALMTPAGEIDAHSSPLILTANGFWRQDGAGTFDPAKPNSALVIRPRAGGVYEDFHHGDEWRRSLEASENWSVIDRRLVHTGGSEGAVAVTSAGVGRGFGVRFSLDFEAPPQCAIGIALGEDLSVRWRSGAWELYDMRAGQVLESVSQPVMSQKDWLLTVTGGSDGSAAQSDDPPHDGAHANAGRGLLFYADGRPIFGRILDRPASGAPRLFTGDRIAIAYVAAFTDPICAFTYSDNSGKVRQTQALDGTSVIVSGKCYDTMGRDAVGTKSARFDDALPAFRPDFVKSLDWHSGVMTGEIADSYPQDEGYPYQRTRYDGSPLARPMEYGLPGRALAIDLSIPEPDRRTTRTRYAANGVDAAAPDLPAGEYLLTGVTDPDGAISEQIIDRAGNVVMTRSGRPEMPAESWSRTRNAYDVYGHLRSARLPNSFGSGVPEAGRFAIRTEYDFFGRMIRTEEPDTAQASRIVYDRAGRIRFTQDANGAAAGYLLYRLYDRIGRVIEDGSCDAAWNEEDLRAHVDDAAWLPGAATPSKRYEYGGDATDTSLIGRLSRVRSYRPEERDVPAVEETFAYDDRGNVIRTAVLARGYDPGAWQTVVHEYDGAGNKTAVACELDGAPCRISYGFNGLGEIESVDLAAAHDPPVRLAEYAYHPGGSIAAERFNPGTSHEIVRRYAYNSAGWLTSIEDPFFRETLDYFGNGYQGAGYHTGKIARVTSRFTGIESPGDFVTSHSYRFAYDAGGRLRVAENDASPAWSIGTTQPVRYDADDNVTAIERGGVLENYAYQNGTNRVSGVEGAAPDQAFGYDPNGNIVRAPGRGLNAIAYDRLSQLATRIETTSGTGECRFDYDGGNRRVVKNAADTTTFYLRGLLDLPMVERSRSSDGTERATLYIYGPTGLIGFQSGGRFSNVLRDRQKSTRAVVSEGVVRAAYNYLPHGDFMGRAYEPEGVARPFAYLYTGQELDVQTGLYNYKARFYDAALGRFYSTDPAGQFASPYVYAAANPVNFVDPTGAWAWDSILALIGGIIMIAVGFIVTVLTAGAATPALIAASVFGAGLIGAGVAGAVAGIGAGVSDKSLSAAEWGISVGLGFVFGAITAGIGAGWGAAGLSTARAAFADALAGVALGALDGYVTNGVMNVNDGVSFNHGWEAAASFGAAGGAVAGFFGALLGRGASLKSSRLVRGTPQGIGVFGGDALDAARSGRQCCRMGHSITGVHVAGGRSRYSHLTIEGKELSESSSMQIFQPAGAVVFDEFRAAGRTMRVNVPAANAAAADAFMGRRLYQESPYFYVANDCTTWTRSVLSAGGLHAPLWVRTPWAMEFWMRKIGAYAI